LSGRTWTAASGYSMARIPWSFCPTPFFSTKPLVGSRIPSLRGISQSRTGSHVTPSNSIPYFPLQRMVSSNTPILLKQLTIGQRPAIGVKGPAYYQPARPRDCAPLFARQHFHSSSAARYDRLQNLEDAANRDRDNANAQAVFLQVPTIPLLVS
jgi:hypothetical protein